MNFSWDGYEFQLGHKLEPLVRNLKAFKLKTTKRTQFDLWAKIHAVHNNAHLSTSNKRLFARGLINALKLEKFKAKAHFKKQTLNRLVAMVIATNLKPKFKTQVYFKNTLGQHTVGCLTP